MFWHFRHTPPGYHRDTMLKLLVALGLAADSLSLPIPCVRSMPARRGDPAGEHLTFRINPFGPQVDLWSTPRDGFVLALDTRRPTDELYSGLKLEQVRSRRRRGLAGGLGLPAEFAVPRGDSGTAWFVIDPPDWLKAGSGVRTRSKDTVTRLGSARISSYAASNVIVVRSHKGARQVLLGRQLDGRWRGEYVLPGGKAKPGESLERCTKRELEEETGLTLARSRPISIHLVRLPGRPLVFSVGAIVTEFDGTPHREERAQNEDWKWFDVGDLPSELALPAKLALGEYLKGRRQDLEWSDVELQWERSTQVPEQLGFGGPFTQDGFDTPGDG
jgi:8-oxo-dGTP diphosphatase